MLVSIITPTYNSSGFIESTINSILNQTYTKWELLITDDCSTDGTWEKLMEFAQNDKRIRIFRLGTNSGPGVARNNSIENAQGRFIAFCDSDDQWLPEKLELQVEFMLKNNIHFAFSNYDIINETGVSIGSMVSPERVNYKKMLQNDYIGCLTAIYDSENLGKFFMPKIIKRQDWALWLAILKKTPYAYNVNKKLALYRKRGNSVSSNKLKVIKYNWAIYRNVEKLSFLKSLFYFISYFFHYFKKRYL